MTTVGIMSMQRIYNYGSSLQAHSLRRLIEDAVENADVSFVDYRPGAPLVESQTSQNKLARAVAKLREYNKVNTPFADKLRFFNHKRTYASRYFPSIGVPLIPNLNLDVDVQVIGSDEVFNCVQSNTNVGFAPDLFGRDSPARRVISYAASFGNTTLEKISAAGVREELSDDLSRFTAVSVRDQNSWDVVKALIGREAEIHLDPTLVHGLMRDPLVPTSRQYQGDYMIVYGYSGRISEEENSQIRSFADQRKLKVLAFGGLQASADEFIDCDPFTLLAYFRDAATVVTDTFHGTIFSILNERPFATIVRSGIGHHYGNAEKLTYLLDRLNLADHAWMPEADLGSHLDREISFDAVAEVRASERERTLNYLKTAVVNDTEGDTR